MSLLARLAVSWAANAVVLAVVAAIFNGVTVDHSFWTLVFAAAVFGVLNTILKPVLKLLTFPLALVTFGIAWFGVAMMMLWLTDVIVARFDIHGFWTLVGATLIAWITNLALDLTLFRRQEPRSQAAAAFRA